MKCWIRKRAKKKTSIEWGNAWCTFATWKSKLLSDLQQSDHFNNENAKKRIAAFKSNSSTPALISRHIENYSLMSVYPAWNSTRHNKKKSAISDFIVSQYFITSVTNKLVQRYVFHFWVNINVTAHSTAIVVFFSDVAVLVHFFRKNKYFVFDYFDQNS